MPARLCALPGKLLGHDAIRQMMDRKYGCQRSLFIGCSANHNDPSVRNDFLDAGAAMCWPKPLPDLPTIWAQLHTHLSGLPGQMRVLIVDDSSLNRKLVRHALARVVGTASWEIAEESSASKALVTMGFRPPTASQNEESKDSEESKESKGPDSSSEWTVEGRDAQEIAAAGVPYDCGYDLIVLDEIMPGSIAGTAAMAVLRRAGSNAVLVGFSGNSMERKHLDAGADLSWHKPLPSAAELGAGLLKKFAARGHCG